MRSRRPAGPGLRAAARLLVALLATIAVRAEEPPADPDLSTEGMRRAGPFHLRPYAVLKDVGYDDNVRIEARTRQGDSTATAGAGLDAVLLAGDRGGVHLFEELNYVAFQKNTDLDHWNGSARARGIALLKGTVLSLEDRFASDRERPNTEIDERLRRTNNSLTGAFHTVGKGRLGLKGSLRDERIDYVSDDPLLPNVGDLLNRDETTLSVIGEMRVLPKTTFTLEGSVSRIQFDDKSQDRDTRKRAILPGFRFDPGAAVQGDLRVGPLDMTALERDGGSYHGLAGDGHLSTRLGRAARLKSEFTRGVEFSTLGSNLFFVSRSWSLALEQFFSRRISGELLYRSGFNHYPLEVPLRLSPGIMGIRDDRLTTWQATVRYRTKSQMILTASAYRLTRDSTDDFYDTGRAFYTFGTTYTY